MSATRKPTRKIASAAKAIPAELTAFAVEFHVQNSRSNEASRKATSARKSLYGGMKNIGLNAFDIETNLDGKPVVLHAEIGSQSREGVDSTKLFALFEKGRIKREDFLAVISASKTAVETVLGKDIMAQVAVATQTEENVSVKPSKG
jgi:hypothetical protein